MQTLLAPLAFLAATVASATTATAASGSLDRYKVSDVTVSGVSAGGYMAVQMHVSFSSIVNGSGVFAAGPFYCAEGTIDFAEYKCMKITQGLPNVNELVTLTRNDYRAGYIDDPAHLKDDRVFMFSGEDDTVVHPQVVGALQSYYSAFIPASQMVTKFDFPAEHCWPTLDYGEACETRATPYMGKCGYDGAGAVLNTLYPGLKPRGQAVAANLRSFSQKAYFSDPLASIGDTGYVYVPTACQGGATCHLHVAFHGCLMYLDLIGDGFPVHAGLNEWAEANNIVVLYPFVVASVSVPYNPDGCWDWWGYTGPLYGVKSGVQMQLVRSMIQALSGK